MVIICVQIVCGMIIKWVPFVKSSIVNSSFPTFFVNFFTVKLLTDSKKGRHILEIDYTLTIYF